MWSSTGFGGHGGRITHQRLTSWSDGYFLEDSNLGGGYNTTLPLLTKLSLCDSVLWREWRETLEEGDPHNFFFQHIVRSIYIRDLKGVIGTKMLIKYNSRSIFTKVSYRYFEGSHIMVRSFEKFPWDHLRSFPRLY